MPYCFVDDHFPDHPKAKRAGGDACWLWVCGYAWVQRNLTGGRIPKAAVPSLSDRRSPMRLARRLVEVGLWHEDGDDFVMHDYVPRNPTAERARSHKESQKDRSAAGRVGARARWHGANQGANGDANDAICDAIASESHEEIASESHPNRISEGAESHANGERAHAYPGAPDRVSPIPQTHSYPSRGEHQGVAAASAPEKEKSQDKTPGQPPDIVARRWLDLWPVKLLPTAREALALCRKHVAEHLVDECIGHVASKNPRPKSPRYLCTTVADWAQQRGANLSDEAIAELTGKAAG